MAEAKELTVLLETEVVAEPGRVLDNADRDRMGTGFCKPEPVLSCGSGEWMSGDCWYPPCCSLPEGGFELAKGEKPSVEEGW